jgi:hypothetical protein
MLIAPPLLFLLATIAYSWGYYPRQFQMNTDSDKDIEIVRVSLMHHRLKWGSLGFLLFLLGVLVSLFVLLFN